LPARCETVCLESAERAHRASYDDARWSVRHANRTIGRVDVLAARAACAHRLYLNVRRVQLHVNIRNLRQREHQRGARVHAAARLGRGHALHAVHAALESERRVRATAGHGGDERRARVRYLAERPALAACASTVWMGMAASGQSVRSLRGV
jgi:hypothetical protein